MERLVIRGGLPLTGEIVPAGNKNGALPIVAAALLTDEPVVLRNVPRIGDIESMLEIMEGLGADVSWDGDVLRVQAAEIRTPRLDPDLARGIRASILFAGPLLARHGAAEVPPPGGDVIGRRRLDSHFLAFAALGAHVDAGEDAYRVSAPSGGLRGTRIFLDEASVTATENAVMAAVLADGDTVIENAACEPHVQDLCRMLAGMGARVDGIGTNRLEVGGVPRLHGVDHTVGPDHIEVASFIALAAVTGGRLAIRDTVPEDLRMTCHTFQRLGVRVEFDGRTCIVPANQELAVVDDMHEAIAKIDDGIWPAFPADLTSIAVALATQAQGTVLIFEKMFENRLFFVDKLVTMGARIILCDPHRVVVSGPTRLRGASVSSPDIRAGMAMLIAAVCAEGETTIYNVGQIDRGYERIDERLAALGADVRRLPA